MRDPPSGRRRMGACETTPTTTRDRGNQPSGPSHAQPAGGYSSLPIVGRRSPASSSFVLARACQARRGGRSSLTPPSRRHKPAATRKATTKVPPQPRRPRTGHRVYPARPLDSWGPYGCEDAASRVHPRQCQAVDIAVSGTDKLEVLWISYMWSIGLIVPFHAP